MSERPTAREQIALIIRLVDQSGGIKLNIGQLDELTFIIGLDCPVTKRGVHLIVKDRLDSLFCCLGTDKKTGTINSNYINEIIEWVVGQPFPEHRVIKDKNENT